MIELQGCIGVQIFKSWVLILSKRWAPGKIVENQQVIKMKNGMRINRG